MFGKDAYDAGGNFLVDDCLAVFPDDIDAELLSKIIAKNNNKLEACDDIVGLRLAGSFVVNESTIKALDPFDKYLTQKNEKHNHPTKNKLATDLCIIPCLSLMLSTQDFGVDVLLVAVAGMVRALIFRY